jgi:putative MATE family efflux protein
MSVEKRKYNETKGVKTLLGEPKKAIITLSIPMIIAMSANTIYNLFDALWVSGFGQEFFTDNVVTDIGTGALAAVGFVLPFFMMIISISVGIGVGAGSAISRRIGANDKEGADNVAVHSIIITVIISIIFSVIFYIFAEDLFILIGAKESSDMAISYGRVIFAGGIFLFFSHVAYAILRGEGDAKRAMYAMMFGAILNIIIDPIFIYTLGYGVTGAAYATVLSMFLSTLLLIYWLFFRKDTYVDFHFNNFKFNKEIIKDIFKVGLPASIQQLSMSITMLILIVIITIVGNGDDGVAIYNTGWRIVMIAILPLLGIATAVTSVVGATFGARSYDKLNIGFLYAIKIGLLLEIIIGIAIFVLAPMIAALFTTTPDSIRIREGLELFLRITILFYPGAAFGIASSSMFQGTGKGSYALIATLLRTVVLTPIIAYLLCCVLNYNLVGIWWALVIANLIGSVISFTWAKYYISKLLINNNN